MAKSCGVQIRFIRNEEKLKAAINLPATVILQLYSPQCDYCTEEAPHFVRASFEYCSAGQFRRVDISELQETTLEDLKVEGIPLILVFRNGVELGRKEGFANFEEISTFLDEIL